MFRPVPTNVRFPDLEADVLQFWRDERIYEKSLERRKNAPPFIFFEGPPTANGKPHPGHCLTRAIKDLFPRYRTMRGYRCERKAGWDTHGLPVEVEVCKELGIHSKEEIEAYGIEPFIQLCQRSVWRYMQEWEKLTERLGFWVNLKDAYVTYHQSFVESVWWALANLFERGLLYQDHKIVWWWAQGGTALSAGEVAQGRRDVADPSVYVRFPLLDDAGKPTETSILVWTTTPWTLPSNQFAAVHPDLEYSVVTDGETPGKLILASALVEAVAGKVKRTLTVESKLKGSELLGRRYQPPFDYYHAKLGNQQGTLIAGGQEAIAWRVVAADFVTTDSGTGVVHQAPAFGDVDFDVLVRERNRYVEGQGPQLICAVGPDGKFTAEAPTYQGRWVKEADRDISRELRERGLLYHQEQYPHDYPFCWRAPEDALIQYPRKSWFIRTTKFKERMLENNHLINWLPEHIRDGRFGNFLESNVDWALSRERYWGTPLPIWTCEATGHREAVASYEELLKKPGVTGTEVWDAAKRANPDLPDDLRVHKPYIDAITYDSPRAAGKRMKRVTEVIDCWFDSGAMPFAQWGYPHQNRDRFEQQFPADFISEALDQTRGWFYSLLSISTMLFGDGKTSATPGSTEPADVDRPPMALPHPFKNCIVLGLMLAESYLCPKCGKRFLNETAKCDAEGCGGKPARKIEKMSKSLRNYPEPGVIFDQYGADALRWYFFANQAPWTSIVYSERTIKDSIPEFLLRLWNCYSFFVIYAGIDGFSPAQDLTTTSLSAALAPDEAGELGPEVLAHSAGYRPVANRRELDRWILSELNRTLRDVVEKMDAYDNYTACGRIKDFVDSLSNWYVRRSRDRFWSNATDAETRNDKSDAHWTLYECLLATAKMIAPFTPFIAETLWQNLAVAPFGDRVHQSVHLCDYPQANAAVIDETLSTRIALGREIVSLGRAARSDAKLKVRQPLAKVEVILSDATHRAALESHASLIAEELNVKVVEFAARADQYVNYTVLPDLKKLGPKLGKQLPAVKKALSETDPAKLLNELEKNGKVAFPTPAGEVWLDREDIVVRLESKPGWAAAHGPVAVVVLSTEITPELALEGTAREVVHAIQSRRKDLSCEYTSRIEVGIVTDSAELQQAVTQFADYVMGETLAVSVGLVTLPGVEPCEAKIGEDVVQLYVKVVS